jgi:GNAT superfamily N-acetyltransferase
MGMTSESGIVLGDGREMVIRPIRPDDAAQLQALHRRASRRSVRLRFFGPLPELTDAMARRFAEVDFQTRAAYVATVRDEDEIRGVVRYEIIAPALAEVAFVVEDSFQRQGIAHALFARLVEHARANGITQLRALVLAENTEMLDIAIDRPS